jgi:small ligand-binding sensory domain FIST
LGSIPIVVDDDDDEVHILLCFRTMVARVVISSTNIAPRISFNGLRGGIVLDGFMVLLEVGSFFYRLHLEVHPGGGHVHLIDGVHPLLLGLETIFLMSFVSSLTLSEKKALPTLDYRWYW